MDANNGIHLWSARVCPACAWMGAVGCFPPSHTLEQAVPRVSVKTLMSTLFRYISYFPINHLISVLMDFANL